MYTTYERWTWKIWLIISRSDAYLPWQFYDIESFHQMLSFQYTYSWYRVHYLFLWGPWRVHQWWLGRPKNFAWFEMTAADCCQLHLHGLMIVLSLRDCLSSSLILEQLPLKIQYQVEKEWWHPFAVGALSVINTMRGNLMQVKKPSLPHQSLIARYKFCWFHDQTAMGTDYLQF